MKTNKVNSILITTGFYILLITALMLIFQAGINSQNAIPLLIIVILFGIVINMLSLGLKYLKEIHEEIGNKR